MLTRINLRGRQLPKVRKITKSVVDKKQPESSRYFVWDEGVPGFGLVVQPSGKKSYCFQYRNSQNQSRRLKLGTHGGKLTTEQIRRKAEALLPRIREGYDPLEEKQARRGDLTVSQLLDHYTASASFANKAETTRKTDIGRIERHLKPLLGRKIANKLTAEQVKKASFDIENGKTAKTVKTGPRGLAIVRGGPGAARMCIRLLKSAYSWAHEEGLVSVNNTARVKVGQDGNKNITLSQEDYKSLFRTIDELEQKLQIRSQVSDAIRVIALTGARRNEIAGLRWRHVDLKRGVIEIPKEEHKTGKSTSEARVIGLPSVAQQIISQQEFTGSDYYVFPPTGGAGPINLSKPWRKIREEAGIHPEAGLHALRHSLATQMAVSGSQAAQIMTVMGHKNLSTAQKYIHIAKQETQDIAEQAAIGISEALKDGQEGKITNLKAVKNG